MQKFVLIAKICESFTLLAHLRPVPTKWETSHKISFPSYNQIHIVQTLSFKMIYYMSWLLPISGPKTHYFLINSFVFFWFFEMFNGPYLLKFPGDLSLILWEQVSFYIEVSSTYSTTPLNHFVHRQKQAQNVPNDSFWLLRLLNNTLWINISNLMIYRFVIDSVSFKLLA